MNERFNRVSIAAGVLLMLLSVAAMAGNTYINDFVNVQVTEPDCYEFSIHVDQASGASAVLTLRVNDVDEESGELDEVYLNGVYLGVLSGTSDMWSTTSFNITSQVIYNADNTVRICIDPGGGEPTDWRAEIDWGQILVDGGSAADGDIVTVSASGTWNAISVQTNVSASNTDDFRLEINLLDSMNNNKDIATEVFPLTGGSSTTRTMTVSLPSEPTATETFTIEANLFNDTTGVQQAVKTTTWAYSADEPPTDIILSDSHVDENLPALTLVGTLTAIDTDSGSHDFTLIGGDIGSFTVSGSELRTSISLDYEAEASYSLHIEAEDAEANTTSKWFTIIVDDVNESPTARNDTASVIEGGATTVVVLANDTDPDNDTVTVADVTDPQKGTAVIQPDDTVSYVPDPGACGTDVFSYTIDDGNGMSSSASVTITIQNLSPSASDDATDTQEAEPVLISVLDNDSDPGSSTLSIQSVSDPRYGNAMVMNDKILYTPIARYEGADRFSYTIQDDCGASATAWVDVDVLRTNHPPEANAGFFYQGIVGEPLVLDASFSYDPDIEDSLQYRWDLTGDGIPNTDWLSTPRYTATYSAPFFGQVVLEVRDIYRGIPTGAVSQATALIRIASLQSIQVFVYEDLNGNGVRDDGEPGMPGVGITINDETMTTEADGGLSVALDAALWVVAMTPQSISNLESRGFAVAQEAITVDLAQGGIEIVELGVAKTSTKVTGFVFVDLDEDGEYNEEVDQRLQGLRVVLDEDRQTLTNDDGRFFFLSVAFGEHVLQIGENVDGSVDSDDEDILSLFVPIILERGASTEFLVLWPWPPVGSDQGFLTVEVEKSGK